PGRGKAHVGICAEWHPDPAAIVGEMQVPGLTLSDDAKGEATDGLIEVLRTRLGTITEPIGEKHFHLIVSVQAVHILYTSQRFSATRGYVMRAMSERLEC